MSQQELLHLQHLLNLLIYSYSIPGDEYDNISLCDIFGLIEHKLEEF